jgi:hypothetical protein
MRITKQKSSGAQHPYVSSTSYQESKAEKYDKPPDVPAEMHPENKGTTDNISSPSTHHIYIRKHKNTKNL